MTEDDTPAAIAAGVRDDCGCDPPIRTPPAPATLAAFHEAEELIGLALPAVLRRLYLEVANGGFGPGFGIYGVRRPFEADQSLYPDLIAGYPDVLTGDGVPEAPAILPRGVVFLCDFACTMWSLLDCRSETGQMWWWEEEGRYAQQLGLARWLELLLNRSLNNPRATWAYGSSGIARNGSGRSHDATDRVELNPDRMPRSPRPFDTALQHSAEVRHCARRWSRPTLGSAV